jgi:hypothetical protein
VKDHRSDGHSGDERCKWKASICSQIRHGYIPQPQYGQC